jgi:hypothetical protein
MIPTMANLIVTDPETGQDVVLSGMPDNVVRVVNAKEASDVVGYYKPAVPTQPTFDAFSITKDGTAVAFQYST